MITISLEYDSFFSMRHASLARSKTWRRFWFAMSLAAASAAPLAFENAQSPRLALEIRAFFFASGGKFTRKSLAK